MKWTESFTYVGRCTRSGDYFSEPEHEEVEIEHEIVATLDNDEFRIYIDNCPDDWQVDIETDIYTDIGKRIGCDFLEVKFLETQSGVCAYKYEEDKLPTSGIHYGWESIKRMIVDYLNDKDFEEEDMRNLYLYGE